MNRRLFQYLFGLTHPTKQTTAGGFARCTERQAELTWSPISTMRFSKTCASLRISAAVSRFFPLLLRLVISDSGAGGINDGNHGCRRY